MVDSSIVKEIADGVGACSSSANTCSSVSWFKLPARTDTPSAEVVHVRFELSSVPHTMLSPSAVPQTMLSPSAVPQTMLSPAAVPHTMLSPLLALATPHVVPRLQAFAVGNITPPVKRWVPHTIRLPHIC